MQGDWIAATRDDFWLNIRIAFSYEGGLLACNKFKSSLLFSLFVLLGCCELLTAEEFNCGVDTVLLATVAVGRMGGGS